MIIQLFITFVFIPEVKWFAKMDDFKQFKISLFAYRPTRKPANFRYRLLNTILMAKSNYHHKLRSLHYGKPGLPAYLPRTVPAPQMFTATCGTCKMVSHVNEGLKVPSGIA